MKQFISSIIDINQIADGYIKLDFHWNGDKVPLAGQFVTFKIGESTSPLLRRPFALSSFETTSGKASIIFQIVGQATKLLSQKKSGDSLDILGPLGNSFSTTVTNLDNDRKKHIVIAGGIGTGPMLYLSEELKNKEKNPILIIGCRSKSLVPFDALNDSIETIICTDDGSYGFTGTVIEYMRSNTEFDKDSVIYSCGPEPMLKACQQYANDMGMSSYVSLEQMMACGVGACMGCTCEIKGEQKYARVCKDGPVFPGGVIKWT